MDTPSASRIRLWPAVTVAAVYWRFRLIAAESEMPMFQRFLSKALGGLAFLLLFLILWLSNGTLSWKVRLTGLAAFLVGIVGAALLAHRSFDSFSFILTAVP